MQTITKEWEIAKAYAEEVTITDRVVGLGWDDFQAFAENHRPMMAIKAEGDEAVKDVTANAMGEIKRLCPSTPSGLIISISYKAGEEIMMDEMFGLSDCINELSAENVEIKWGINKNDHLKHKRCVQVFAFE